MKILPLSKTADWQLPQQEMLKEEFRTAKRFAEVRVGTEYIFYRSFIRVRIVPVSDCERMFLRVEMAEYGDLPVHEHTLVILTKKGEELGMRIDRPDDAKEVLAYMEANFTKINYGKGTKG